MIRVYLSGEHAHRTPLSYPALAPLFKADISFVADPAQADICVFAHILDIQNTTQVVVEDWRHRQRPIVLLSEEPFWDTIWGDDPLAPLIYVDTAFGTVPVHQINHATSDVFRFDKIPYYLLTNPRFFNAYTEKFARNAARNQSQWRALIDAYAWDVTFMFERRPEPYHSVSWSEGDLIGLCAWRTNFAEAYQTGRVARLGKSWQGGVSRFELKGDWHQDKLHRLDGQSRIVGAVENTHHPDYITEKFFDALACGGVPLYYASPNHRIHDFGLPTDSWINLYNLTPAQAVDYTNTMKIDDKIPAIQMANAALLDLFSQPDLVVKERARLRGKLVSHLAQLSNI